LWRQRDDHKVWSWVIDMVMKERRMRKKVRKVKAGSHGKARARGKGMFIPLVMLALIMGSAVTAGTYYMTLGHKGNAKPVGPYINNNVNDSFGQDNLDAWSQYGAKVNATNVVTIDPGLARATPGKALENLTKEEGKQNFTDTGPVNQNGNKNSNSNGNLEDGAYGAAQGAGVKAPAVMGAAKNTDSKSSSTTQVKREVEEADMVKVIGDRIYVLNSYRGLVVVNISDPAKAHVEGRCGVIGYPIDMYVIDFLAIVTVRSDYGFWYNYWNMESMDGTPSGTGHVGTSIYIINAKDATHPVIMKIVELEGFASESRRVGHVVYETTNTYSWYNGGAMTAAKDGGSQQESKEYTFVTSIDLGSPATLGMKDRVKFDGNSGQVYASPTAFYVAQTTYQDAPWYSVFYADSQDPYYHTKITYLDIQDPNGDIVVRDHITVPGEVSDKYQMDEYNHMFRVVAHFWTNNGQQSWLYIYNVTDPRDIKMLGKLDIDDTGSLMATRFAGTRAYTIHLPQAKDPLDVLDLSDPKHPKLCDVLEMPGWVTHLDVYGNSIIALGVDNSNGEWNVAVSLFDVTDAYEAKLQDRVRIGGGYAYSEANYEPKALTTDQAHHIVIVPFQSWSGASWNTTAGLEIVGFDLAKGDLELKGEVRGPYPIERTRVVGDYILAASDRDLQVIDISNLMTPVVRKTLDLCVNVVDVVPAGGYHLQLVEDWVFGGLALRSTVGVDDLEAVQTLKVNSSWGHLYMSGSNIILAADLNDGKNVTGTLFQVTVGADGSISLTKIASMPTGTAFLGYDYNYGGCYQYYYPRYYYYYSPYNDEQMGIFGNTFVFVKPFTRAYVDYTWDSSTGRYTPSPMTSGSSEVYVFDLSNMGNVPAPAKMEITTYQYIGMSAWKGTVYIQHQYTGYTWTPSKDPDNYYGDWTWNYKNYVIAIDLKVPSSPVQVGEYNIPGRLVGQSDGYLYTVVTAAGHEVLNVLSTTGGVATVVSATDLGTNGNDLMISDGMAYVLNVKYPEYIESENKYDGTTTTSYLRAIDLSVPTAPKLVTSVAFDGILSLMTAQGGHLVIYDSARGSVLAYSVGLNGGLTFNAMLNVQGYPQQVRIVQGVLYIPEGYYGAVAAQI